MMLARAALSLGLAGLLGAAAAYATEPSSPISNGRAPTKTVEELTLAPRTLLRKLPTKDLAMPDAATGRLIVKFMDGIKARAKAPGKISCAGQHDLGDVNRIVTMFELTCRPAIMKSAAELAAVEARARAKSRKQQPDLAGMIHLDGPRRNLEAAAKALNELDNVEWVTFEVQRRIEGGDEDPDCGVPGVGSCFDPAGNGSPFCDEGGCCEFICDQDPFCCDDQFGGAWDEICAAQANLLCFPVDPGVGADRCNSAFNGSCFEARGNGGCNNFDCCAAVCEIDPQCCQAFWDQGCVTIAFNTCTVPMDEGPTPDYTPIQAYLTALGFAVGVPEELDPFVPKDAMGNPFVGWGGEGFALGGKGEAFQDLNGNGWRDQAPGGDQGGNTGGEPFDDENGNGFYDLPGGGEQWGDTNNNGWFDAGEPWDDADGSGVWEGPRGLRGTAEELLRRFNVNTDGRGNSTDGRGRTVAVIEFACRPNHEDIEVVVEPGQTMIDIPALTGPDHGTACLSIIGGTDNGFGVTGIAPKVDLRFYPITSIEQGPRELTAWISAIADLEAGDVISASYGPGFPFFNLNNDPSTNTLFRLATDTGITVCVAAGNACQNLDEVTPQPDSGAIVVGACSPGSPYYRLSFSNYFNAAGPGAITRSNIVHCKAWGDLTTSAGYGVLRLPDQGLGAGGDFDSAYTPTFGGTSAACPQIAGLVAAVQGLASQFYGIPFSAEAIREAFGMPGNPPPVPSRGQLNGGTPEMQPPCNVDTDPTQAPNYIGVYPSVPGILNTILTQGPPAFDDSPLLDDVIIVRGVPVFGNIFSVKRANDNILMRVQAQFTERSPGPSGRNGVSVNPRGSDGGGASPQTIPEINQLAYLATGNITDLVLVGHADPGSVTTTGGLSVTANMVDVQVPMLNFVEAYDFLLRRWVYLGIEFTSPTAGTSVITGNGADARRFIRQGDSRVLARLWNLGFTAQNSIGAGSSGVRTPRVDMWDFITIEFVDDFGEEVP